MSLERVEEYARKHNRSTVAIKSKIQKIRANYQSKLESELDTLFIKKQPKAPYQEPHQMFGAARTDGATAVPVSFGSLQEIKEFLSRFLSQNAEFGMEQSILRARIPKETIDSGNLARAISDLEQEKKLFVVQLPGLQLDPNRLQFFDKAALEHVKHVLRKKYKCGLVEGIYPLDVLFEGNDKMRETVTVTHFLNIRLFNFIVWAPAAAD